MPERKPSTLHLVWHVGTIPPAMKRKIGQPMSIGPSAHAPGPARRPRRWGNYLKPPLADACVAGGGASWRSTLVMIFIAIVVVIATFAPTAWAIVGQWSTGTYSHGFLVIPVSLYLVWQRRAVLAAFSPRPTLAVLPIIALLALTWLAGQLTATGVIQQVALIGLVIAIIWGLVGSAVAIAALFPLSFLLFALPVGGGLIPLLQDFSAWLAVSLLDLSGVPVLLEGRFISVPYGHWEVAEVCSGIRALIACMAMGFLYAGLAYRRWTYRLTFLLASAAVPIIANGIRIYGIVLLGYLGGNPAAVAADHLLAGWAFTAIVMALLLVIGHRWRESTEQTASGAGSVPGTALPAVQARSSVSAAVVAVSALLIAATAPLAAELLWRRLEAGPSYLATPIVSAPWEPQAHDTSGWQPRFHEASVEQQRTFTAGDRWVKLYAAYYPPNRRATKLVSSTNELYQRGQWQRLREGSAMVVVDGRELKVRETLVRSGNSSLLIWSWYRIDSAPTSNEYLAKWWLAKDRLLGGRSAPVALALATRADIPGVDAGAVLNDFLAHFSLAVSQTASANR